MAYFLGPPCRVPGLLCRRCLRDPMFSHFDTIPACDRRTDRWTDTQRRLIPLQRRTVRPIAENRLFYFYPIQAQAQWRIQDFVKEETSTKGARFEALEVPYEGQVSGGMPPSHWGGVWAGCCALPQKFILMFGLDRLFCVLNFLVFSQKPGGIALQCPVPTLNTLLRIGLCRERSCYVVTCTSWYVKTCDVVRHFTSYICRLSTPPQPIKLKPLVADLISVAHYSRSPFFGRPYYRSCLCALCRLSVVCL